MGLIMKKDDSEDNEYIDGIEVVGRGEGPNGDDEVEHVEIHEGLTAEDISGKTAAAEAERELERFVQVYTQGVASRPSTSRRVLERRLNARAAWVRSNLQGEQS